MQSRSKPLQNRVLPTGDIVSASFRGAFTGNRGILAFDDQGQLGTSRWKHQHWLICALDHPRGRYHGPQPALGWTPLFFSDEAVGLAAGHRPCAYCRRAAYETWRDAWARAYGQWPGHKDADKLLHQSRVTRRRMQVRHDLDIRQVPVGAFISWQNTPHLVHKDGLFPWKEGGYGSAQALPDGLVEVLSPAPTLAVLRAGFKPVLALT